MDSMVCRQETGLYIRCENDDESVSRIAFVNCFSYSLSSLSIEG